MPDKVDPDISLVILCYQTGQKIHAFLNRVIENLDELTPHWEIVLVGNYHEGVPDDTPAVVREIAKNNPKIRAVAKPKEGMMGWDARSGFAECTGKTIAIIDGDEQMVAVDIQKAYKMLVSGGYDLVKPFRTVRYDPWIRQVNTRVYNFIYNLLFPGYPIRDVHSKPKIFTREAFQKIELTANDWFMDAELMIQARRYKMKLGEFPTVFHRAVHRKSFVRFHTIFEFIKNLVRARVCEFFKRKV